MKHMVRGFVCLAIAAGVLFTASAEGLPGTWVKISFRKTEMKVQIQLSEIGVYDADGKRLNLGMTKVDVGTDPASLAEKQFVTSANASGQNKDKHSNCFDNNLGTKWYQGVDDLDETTPSTWRTVTMRLEYNAQPLGYNFATAGDLLQRSPISWIVSVSTNGTEWTTVDEKSGASHPSTFLTWYNNGVPYAFRYPWVPFEVALDNPVVAYRGEKDHVCGVTVTDYETGAALTEGTHYTVSYANNRAIGTATVTVTGIGAYAGTTTRSFEIVPALDVTLSATEVVSLLTEPCTVDVTVRDVVTGEVLDEGEDNDYLVECENNNQYGTATVTVTGVNDYEGNVVKKTFSIVSPYALLPARYWIATKTSPSDYTSTYRWVTLGLHDGNYVSYQKDLPASSVALYMDFGFPRTFCTVAVAPRNESDGYPDRIRNFELEASNDLETWVKIHVNTLAPPKAVFTQYKLNQYDGTKYRYVRLTKPTALNQSLDISELGMFGDGLIVSATADADPFAGTGVGSADAASGVSVAGKIVNSENGAATVEAFFASEDLGCDYAAWKRNGQRLALGECASGATFSGRMAGLKRGRWFWRIFATCGGETVPCQPTTPIVVGSRIVYPKAYVGNSNVGLWYDGNTGTFKDMGDSTWMIFDLKGCVPDGWVIDGIRGWCRSDYLNRFMSAICDFGYDPEEGEVVWDVTTPGSGTRVVNVVSGVPANIVWTSDVEHFLFDNVAPVCRLYHAWQDFRATKVKVPRYVRFRNSQSGNLTEIEFRVRKDKIGLMLFIK